jgi:hypothetical protein
VGIKPKNLPGDHFPGKKAFHEQCGTGAAIGGNWRYLIEKKIQKIKSKIAQVSGNTKLESYR